jgi:hypothetical protein
MIPEIITIEAHDKDGKSCGRIKMSMNDLKTLEQIYDKNGVLVAYDMLMTSIAENIGG